MMQKSILFIAFLLSTLWLSGQGVIYVDADANGANNGSTWQDAYTDLSEAIDDAQSGDQVWVAAGIYVPTSQPNYDIGSSNERFNHFTLKNGVSLVGGFAGDETSIDQRDLDANKTVLSGDLGGDDNIESEGYVADYTDVNGGNVLKLFYFPEGTDIDTTAVLDGFVLSGAVADNDVFPYMGGAAMLCQGASPKVVNCDFYGNYAKVDGGAIWINQSSMIIENCTFSGNYAETHAGAVYFENTSASLKECTFSNNTAKYGGAVYIEKGDETSVIENCVFDNNQTLTSGNGGGISISGANVFMTNTSFTNNTADAWGGGVVFNSNCDVDMINCIVNSNTAGTYGGGIGAHSGGAEKRINVRITNSKIQGNEALGAGGGGISFRYNADGQLFNTLISGNKAAYEVSGLDVIGSSVVDVTNTTIVDNVSGIAAIRVAEDGSKINIYNSILYHTGTDFNYDDAQKITLKSTRYTDGDTNLYTAEDGIITDNPRFLDAPGHNGEAHTNGDYRLWNNSPVNNRGSNTYLSKDEYDLDGDGDTNENIPYDLDGKERVFAGVVDIGCYEQQFETSSGNAIVFDGVDDYVELNGLAQHDFSNSQMTVECWVNIDPSIEVEARLFSVNTSTGGNRIFFSHDNGRGFYVNPYYSTGAIESGISVIDKWAHIAFVLDKGVTNGSFLVVNGEITNTFTYNGDIMETTDQISLGQEFDGASTSDFYKGRMDELRVWDDARTVEEIRDNMNQTLSGNEDNLALYYTFDQVISEEIEDLAGFNNGTIHSYPSLVNDVAVLTPVLHPVSNVGIDNFTISWFPVPNAAEYYIDVATDPDFNNLVISGEPTNDETSYTINGLSRGTIYYYKVNVQTNADEWGSQSAHTVTKMNPPGNAFSFDGSTYIDATEICKYPYGATTIETWVKVDASDLNSKWSLWACNPSDGYNNYTLFYENEGGTYKFQLSQYDYTNDGYSSNFFDNTTLVADTWYHIAVVIDKDSDYGEFFLNGESKGTFSPLEYPYPYGSYFSIGQEYDLNSSDEVVPSDYITGEVDEFRIWNAALTQNQIQANKDICLNGDESDLIVYYSFDQQTGTKIADNAKIFDAEVVGNPVWVESTLGLENLAVDASAPTTTGFSLTWNEVAGATEYFVDVATDGEFLNLVVDGVSAGSSQSYDVTGLENGTRYYFRVTTDNTVTSTTNYTTTLMEVPGNALILDGKGDYLEANQLSELNFGATATMECWVNVDENESFGRILSLNTSSGGNRYLLSYSDSRGYHVYSGKDGGYINSNVNSKGSWVHVALVVDYPYYNLYINGKSYGVNSGGYYPFKNGDLFSVGQEFDGADASDFLKGAIDEVRIWNTNLTNAQILANMNKKLTGDEANLEAYYDFDQIEGTFVNENVRGLNANINGNPQWIQSDAIITPLVNNPDEVTPNSIALSWNAVENASKYYLEISTDDDFSNVTEYNTTESSYNITGLNDGTDYFIRLASETTRKSAWGQALAISTLLTPPGNAYHFDGTNYISMDEVTNEDYSNGATIDLWLKAEEKGVEFDVPHRSMVWANNESDGGNHYILNYNSIDKSLSLWGADQTIEVDLNNSWNHVAVVLRNNQPSYIYVNGKEMASFTEVKEPLLTNSRFSIGQEWDGDDASDFYVGDIDEVRIWNKALTLSEIKSYYHTAIPGDEPGLISYFNFDETEGSFVYDANGAYSGEVVGNTKRIESKALITPFTTGATNITNEGFTANWETINGASTYYVRVATDPFLTNPIEGWESVEAGDVTSFEVTGLEENTMYYYGAMSETDRLSAWSPGSDAVTTTGGTTGELAANLHGTSNYIDLSEHIVRFAGKNAGAITGWFKASEAGTILKMTGATSGDNVQVIVGDFFSGYEDESLWFICSKDGDYDPSFGVREGHDKYLDNNWHHFAVIMGDGNNRFVIDGEEKEVFFHKGTAQSQEFTNITGPNNFTIGQDVSVMVDELAFYKNPITNNEVRERAHRKLTGDEIGLVAYYSFDNSTVVDDSGLGRDGVEEGAVSFVTARVTTTPFLNPAQPGVTIADLSWDNIDGATDYSIDVAEDREFKVKLVDNHITSSTTYQATGLDKNSKYFYRVKAKTDGEWSEFSGTDEFFTLPGNALVLDGENDYVAFDDIANYPSDEATIECWVKVEQTSGKDAIWAHNNNINGDNQYVLLYNSDNKELNIATMNSDGTYGNIGPFSNVNLLSSWHHLAVSIVKDGESFIYLDGKQIGQFTHHLAPIVNGYQFAIGQEWDNDPAEPSQFLNGQFDEFRVWNIALTEAEIRANMNVSEPEGADEHYIAHYTFDEIHHQADGVNVFKDQAKQNDATIVNGSFIRPSEGVINPITLEPTDITPGSFTLHLNDIASAQSYELEIAHDSTFVPPLAMHENIGKVASFNATGLCPGVKYYYRVRAIYDENTISAWSTYDTVRTIDDGAVITEFSATAGDYSGMQKLSWSCENSYLVTDFEIKRRLAGTEDEFEHIITLENNDAYFYTDTTAAPGTYYEYSIQGLSYCYDNDTEVDTSNVGFRLPTVTVGKDDGRIRLDWVYADNFAQNLEIVRKDVETGIEQVFQEVADSLHYCDETMSLCVPYQYTLISKTKDFGDVSAKPVTYTLEEDIFDAIDTLDADKGYKDSKITLNWISHKQSIIDEYHISRRQYASGNDWEIVKIIDKGTTQVWIDEEAFPGTYYEYNIIGIGTCGDTEIFTDSATSIGFRQPEGVINGQISYEGGNPVRDVRVVADYDESGETYGSCLEFDGSGYIELYNVLDNFTFENGMTIEMWINPDDIASQATLFQNTGVALELDGTGAISVQSGSAIATYDLSTDNNDVWESGWNHVAFTANDAKINLLINGENVATHEEATSVALDSANIMVENYAGSIDEFRIWNTMRSDSIVARNHSLVLPREQDGLIAALRFDENLGAYAFDHTRTESEPNKNHARIYNGLWSKNIPSTAKLALAAISEPAGNYQINGVWFKGSGETFSITPVFGVHEFDPATRNMLISENSLIYNNQDFTDISAFAVTGNVKYYNADFPVEGAMLYMDGQLMVNAEGVPIVSDADGNFEIEVPIGDHFVSVSKMGHTFSEGFFPPKDENGEVTYHNFNNPVSGIQFIDSSFMIVAGRIVGGTTEGDKVIGFGKSINNLGVCEFTVRAKKGYPIDAGNTEVTVSTDTATGEYEVRLFPEEYEFVNDGITHIGNDLYDFGSIDDLANLDLTSAPVIQQERDTATIMEVNGTDTTYYDTVYIYEYHKKRNWIHRSVPSIEVTDLNDNGFFSDSTYISLDENQDTVVLDLVDADGNHTFPYPVFTKGKQYKTLIKVFEKYENADNGSIDSVLVKDGSVTVINGCANYPGPVEYEIDNGFVEYNFYGGFPNPTVDQLNPDLSYTKPFEVHAYTGEGGSIQSQWPESGPYRAYVFGGIPTGNNFVTQGPDLVDFILRDPPGSNSSSYFEEGFTVSKTESSSFNNSNASSLGVEIDLGWKVTTFAGIGAGVILENEQIANVETGVTYESGYESSHTTNTTTTFTQSYSTSSDPLYVGEGGDIFFGHATNISYGVSNFIKPIVPGTGENEVGDTVNGFVIGLKKAINFGLEYSTDFIYTQNHIENYLIPDLESMSEYHDVNGNADSAAYYMDQANHWRKVLGQNEFQKYVAMTLSHPDDKNISFDAGSIYEQSMTSEVTETITTEFEFGITASVASEVGLEIGSVGTTWSMSHESSFSQSSSSENSTTESKTVGFTLEDGDQGDYFSVDILKDYFGNGPVFITKGGQSACPYEGGTKIEYADYYDGGTLGSILGGFENDVDLNAPTMRIEVPVISAENAIVSGVPDNQPAMFTLKLSNLSEVNADNWFTLKVDAASNPYGAKLKMDGASIVNGVAILVPGGTTLTKTLEFEKGRDDIFNYENINIILHSQCQFDPTDDIEDIADTLQITANFVPTCSYVALTAPTDNWLVNVDANDTLPAKIAEYNLQHSTLEKIAYQYRPASAASWNTQAMFFHDTSNYAAYSGEKYKIDGADFINYEWDMTALQDRNYDIRVVSLCSDGSEYASDPLTGTLDGVRPQLFGTPSPADGILDPNDEIMVTFNEPVEEGLITSYNFDIEGVLNGSEISHGTSLSFDGDQDYATTPAGINLAQKSFTIEFWAQKTPDAGGTVVSQGLNNAENLDIRFNGSSIVAIVNGVSYSEEIPFTDELWHHYAVVFDKLNDKLSIYADDQILLEADCDGTDATGEFVFGKSNWDTPDYLTANIHDVRVWKRALSFTDIIEQMNVQLTGNELGIFANWPMNEGEGTIAEEIVHSRHANLSTGWLVTPSSSGYELNGADQALAVNTAAIPVINEMDMTIELWFKGNAPSADAYLFSNGNTASELYDAAKTIGVKMNTSGNIVVESNNVDVVSPSAYDDDQWHHLAFVVNRRAYASLFIDGEKVASEPSPAFGSMEAAYAYIGALGYLDNASAHQLSNYFAGNVDELRLWKVARTQDQINIYRNVRLAGNEVGLIGYFPFETFEEEMGVMVSTPTLNDQSIDPNSPTGASHCGELTVIGTENLTDIAPGIKRERPKQSVNFDYVVNDDQIILTPTDPLSAIEETILEITVKNVQDKNSNVMASPATWTAFVNKNQVKWQENLYEFEKEIEDALSFEAVVENNSGVVQAFTISNLPAWLTVNPVQGTIQPNQTVTISFDVADGLNIGNYNEDIFLESNSGVNERLTLDLRVYKQGPDWSVDETQFDVSMNIISQVVVQDVFSTDPYDMIGVFAGEECRGVAHLEFKENYDDYFAFLVVYGNDDAEELTYKYWDASEGKILTDVTPEFDFEPNMIHGSMSEPILFNVGLQETAEISLLDGWKWISFNLEMEDPSVNNTLSNLEPESGDIVKHREVFASFDPVADSWIGSLNQFEIGKLYRLKYSQIDDLDYQGIVADPANFDIELVNGWNSIGFVPSQNMTVAEALAGFEPQVDDVIKGQFQFAMFDGYDWMGSLNFMEPGKGYMYRSLNMDTVVFTYPQVSSIAKDTEIPPFETKLSNKNLATDYEYAMSVVALVGISEPDEYQLQAFVDGELRGEAQIIADGIYEKYAFITVFGNVNSLQQDISFALTNGKDNIPLHGAVDFTGNNVAGTLNTPVELNAAGTNGISDYSSITDNVSVYPNPFTDEIAINWKLEEKSDVEIGVFNMLGEQMTTISEGYYEAGEHQVVWGGENRYGKPLDDGVYFIKIKSNTIDKYIKVIKK